MLYKCSIEKIMTRNIFVYTLSEFSSDEKNKHSHACRERNDNAALLIVHSYLGTVKTDLFHGSAIPFLDMCLKDPLGSLQTHWCPCSFSHQ